jgi:2-C-methyl-D-erythritol 4-phosphate cytidylyltransferase
LSLAQYEAFYFLFSLWFKIIAMNYAIIAAGGKGKRFQSSTSKQLLPLLGRPVLSWTLQPFIKSREIDQIILAYPQDENEAEYQRIMEQENITHIKLVKGGDSRYRSVRNAFESIQDANANDLILIHDAARPLLRLTLLKALLDSAAQKGTSIPVLPVQETVKRVHEGRIEETLFRENLFVSQTPQVFQYSILAAAYSFGGESAALTDEAMLVEKSGAAVYTIPGDRKNIKITEPSDLELVEFYLSKGWE